MKQQNQSWLIYKSRILHDYLFPQPFYKHPSWGFLQKHISYNLLINVCNYKKNKSQIVPYDGNPDIPKKPIFRIFGGLAAGSGDKKAPPLLAPHAVGVHPRVARRGAALQRLMEVGDRR